MKDFSMRDFVIESNRIEGIEGCSDVEVKAHENFIALKRITVDDLQVFVEIIQPGAKLRERRGMDVRVGMHFPIRGGPMVRELLETLLVVVENGFKRPYQTHCDYETLHPFMDGNGRSGRAIWAWQQHRDGGFPLGFLHHFYYQSLEAYRPVKRNA